MKDCQTGEARLKRFLPPDVKVAHKTGTLPGVVNDAGIIFTKKKDYILAIFINKLNFTNKPYVAIGENIIAKISHEIYKIINHT
jgi:beta-lactamase class A